MQDIDFDELDKAVSSVTDPKKSDDKSPDSVSVNVGTSVRSDPPSSPLSSSTASRRSSGRFMDMVHPTSDMRSIASEVPERSNVPERPDEPEAPARSFEWPDPIDVTGTHSESKTEEPEKPAEDASAKPLESPFLNDTKVEKRPLGAFSDSAPVADTSLLVDEEPAPEKEEAKKESTEDEAKAEELQTEALIQEAKSEEPEKPTERPVEEAPAGPTSITQQYKEQPSTADQPSGAVFDTEEYHKPLAHPPKKRSSVSIILWIIALILIGGGVGAAIYFFVLPLL